MRERETRPERRVYSLEFCLMRHRASERRPATPPVYDTDGIMGRRDCFACQSRGLVIGARAVVINDSDSTLVRRVLLHAKTQAHVIHARLDKWTCGI